MYPSWWLLLWQNSFCLIKVKGSGFSLFSNILCRNINSISKIDFHINRLTKAIVNGNSKLVILHLFPWTPVFVNGTHRNKESACAGKVDYHFLTILTSTNNHMRDPDEIDFELCINRVNMDSIKRHAFPCYCGRHGRVKILYCGFVHFTKNLVKWKNVFFIRK